MCLFDELNQVGKKGEKAVFDYYQRQGANIIDVSNNEEYQKKDIDFLINGQSVEVKTGTKIAEYKEICIELESNSLEKHYKKGWFYTSKAEVIIYYSPNEKIFYEIGFEPLRKLYEENKEKYKTKTIYRNEFADVLKPSRIAFIPLNEIKENISFFRITNIERMIDNDTNLCS